jgi:hypothetical protein
LTQKKGKIKIGLILFLRGRLFFVSLPLYPSEERRKDHSKGVIEWNPVGWKRR